MDYHFVRLDELNSAGVSGTLTVAGETTELGSDLTSVHVNGESADVYEDGSFAAPGFTPATGPNTYTAIAQDNIGRASANSVTANVVGNRSYTYDANGNLTSDGVRNFAYNDENQLIGVWSANSWSNSFAYDGLMRKRIERDFAWNGIGWAQTNEILYVYDGNLVLQERDGHDEPLTTCTRGIDLSGTLDGAGGIGGLLARSDNQRIVPAILCPEHPNPQNVVTSYYFSDVGGNVVQLFAPNGMILAQYEYDPFGNLISKNGLMADMNKFRFSSKEWEGNEGIYYYGYRFYDPDLQRWPNRDPLKDQALFRQFVWSMSRAGFLTFLKLSQNSPKPLDAFAANSPVNLVDADGLFGVGQPTGVQECTEGIHEYLNVNGQGYGFYPTHVTTWGLLWDKGRVVPDSGGNCTDVNLDPCNFNIPNFNNCVNNQIQNSMNNPPTYDILFNNCRDWVDNIVSSCLSQSENNPINPTSNFPPVVP